jgi:hypothetical protein
MGKKYSKKMVRRIAALHKMGMSSNKIAAAMGISASGVDCYVVGVPRKGQVFADVDPYFCGICGELVTVMPCPACAAKSHPKRKKYHQKNKANLSLDLLGEDLKRYQNIYTSKSEEVVIIPDVDESDAAHRQQVRSILATVSRMLENKDAMLPNVHAKRDDRRDLLSVALGVEAIAERRMREAGST